MGYAFFGQLTFGPILFLARETKSVTMLPGLKKVGQGSAETFLKVLAVWQNPASLGALCGILLLHRLCAVVLLNALSHRDVAWR